MQREGNYPVPPGVSADISGMEYAGEVDSLGPLATLWKTGDRVMGIIGGAGHAEYLCVHESEAMPVPKGMSWEDAAAIPEVFLTAYDALFNRLALRTGETLLIHAVGSGVGTAALQIARVAGARVVGTARSAGKARAGEEARPRCRDRCFARGLGRAGRGGDRRPTRACRGGSRGRELPRGEYARAGVARPDRSGRSNRWRDRAIQHGRASRKAAHHCRNDAAREAAGRKIAVARDLSEHILPLFDAGRLKPVVDRVFPFDEIRAAHKLMESNETFGKIVLAWQS